MDESGIQLSAFWLVYFMIHSILADNRIKQYVANNFPPIFPWYRIIYNLIATLLLLPLVYYIYYVPSDIFWTWNDSTKFIADTIALAAIAGFFWTFRYYDGMEFLGLRNLKPKPVNGEIQFSLSPLHRFVRHPWYSMALLVIWTRDMNEHMFITAALVTGYFFVGSYLEDQKLTKQYGQPYQDYRKAVPGIIPSFRRHLSKQDLHRFLQ